MNSRKVKNGKLNEASCAVLPRGFGSGDIIRAICRQGAWPESCHECKAVITHTGLADRSRRLHPRVLRPGRAESGAFGSTPALHMIGARADSVVSIFSIEANDTHILMMKINSRTHTCTCANLTPHLPQLSRKWASYFI